MTEFGNHIGDWVGLIGLLLASAACLEARLRRRRLAVALAHTEARLKHLEQDLGAVCSTGAGIGERVVELEQGLRRAMQWQSQLELRNPQTEPLRHAINLVERGASAEELVSACGLSHGEAELMARFRSRAA